MNILQFPISAEEKEFNQYKTFFNKQKQLINKNISDNLAEMSDALIWQLAFKMQEYGLTEVGANRLVSIGSKHYQLVLKEV